MNRRTLGFGAAGIVVVGIVLLLSLNGNRVERSDSDPNDELAQVEPEVIEPQLLFGIDISDKKVVEGKIKRNQTIADILSSYNISRQEIFELDRKSKKVFSVRNLVPRKNYTLIYSDDSFKRATHFVYEPNSLEYVIYSFVNGVEISKEERAVEIVERTMAGRITVSLDHSIRQQGGSAALVNKVAEVFGWQIDFYGLQKNDWFKVIYEDRIVDGESIGVGEVISAEFNHIGSPYYAYGYDGGDGIDFYDEEGESLQRAFLRWPVEFSRISSRYNPRRYLKFYGRVKAHLGTDFAAGKGTPIKAAADGIVVTRGFTRANGNWVKIKHNSTYTTGYLHMSRFGKFKQGQRVRKGDVIGYVGKTGNATGYHLCFRFWKHGQQVDYIKEKSRLPSENPIEDNHRARFAAFVELQNKKLSDIQGDWADRTLSAGANQ